ncbi:hypothetical protein M3612_23975 [Niallia taxi]|uniref:hypothetical protein n=1 Tax=Niallia taxi TaxID=2499688 RepID=UPI00124830D0|nr:hypothetical protein [Niallia taxi]MCM3217541.1 hypothetical protein [Niallia taxi]MDK8642915.1 hypothetical protein [Niallia taxi]
MKTEKVALNYALMIEQVKSNDVNDEEILMALAKGNIAFFREFGRGLPDWEALFTFYQNNRNKLEQLLKGEYEISFLTKGTLKRFLLFKFGLQEGKDYKDRGEILAGLILSNEDYENLMKNIARNWVVNILEHAEEKVRFNIELRIKPVI